MTREKEVELLMKDGDTRSEAEKHLKDGAMIIEDLEENLENYLDEWGVEEEDREAYRNMIEKRSRLQTGESLKMAEKLFILCMCFKKAYKRLEI